MVDRRAHGASQGRDAAAAKTSVGDALEAAPSAEPMPEPPPPAESAAVDKAPPPKIKDPIIAAAKREEQAAALKAWAGKKENEAAGAKAFAHRAKMNGLAAAGKWAQGLEKVA